jgi:WD40 repeat protein
MHRGLAVLILLVLPLWLLAQPPKEGTEATGTPEVKEAPDTAEDLGGKVSLGLNTGGHAAPINQMTFTPDGKWLITERGFEVQVWNVQTGAQERVWRLPTYLRSLAVSADWVAAAGNPPPPADGGQGPRGPTPIWLLPLPAEQAPAGKGGAKPPAERAPEVISKPWPDAGIANSVWALAFSPDGTRLAFGDGNRAHVYDLKAKVVTHTLQPTGPQRRGKVHSLSFSKDGTRLLVGLSGAPAPACQVWDVQPPKEPGPTAIEPSKPLGLESSDEETVAWSADNKRFAILHGGGEETHGISVCAADGKLQRKFDHKLLNDAFTEKWWYGGGLHFLPSGKILAAISADAFARGAGASVALLDPQTGELKPVYKGPTQVVWLFRAAVSPDGKLLAVTTDPGYDVVLLDLATKKEVRRLGPPTPAPRFVGWGKDNQTIAWGFKHPAGKPRVAALSHALNLATLERPSEERKNWPPLQPGQWNPDKWKISTEFLTAPKKDPKTGKPTNDHAGVLLVKPNGQRLETSVYGWITAWTTYKDGNRERFVIALGTDVILFDPKANKVLYTLPTKDLSRVVDVAVSPDNRYLLIAGGNQALALFDIEGKPRQLLNILVAGEDWVAWAPEGGSYYYAATPGGEKLIGWQVKQDDYKPLAFYPVERFRKLYYKPEVIQELLATGSVEKALPAAVRKLEANGQAEAARKLTKTRDVKIEDSLPPKVEIKDVKKVAGGVQITARATASADREPVLSLRLLLDGRAHPDAKPVEIKPGAAAEATWTIAPVPGTHEVKVLARCEDVSGASEARVLEAPLPATDKPLLYRICVGINDYDQAGLKLGSARQDAEAVFDALEKDCTGKDNRFGAADGVKLLDKKATRDNVLKALQDVRQQKKVRPGDLVVVFFGCHGVVQRGEFFLLTCEADPGKPLEGKSLSGKDLQDAFADMPCSVLLIMDACHSTAGAVALKPATDDLTRSMSDDQVAVTVLAAAMGHETAGEVAGKHGLFTQALLDALKADRASGVAFDPHDHQMYVHHLFSYVFSEVRRASEGRQNPFLNMPWTVPPLAIREVSPK